MNHLNFKGHRSNYSVQHSFNLVFGKIETVFFSFLCVVFLITSRLSSEFSKDVSFAFVSVSLPIAKFASLPFNGVISVLTNFQELVDAKKENAELKTKLEKLESFYIKSLNVYQENKELRDTLGFISAKSSNYKVARILGHAHQIFGQRVFIDAGKNNGLKEGSIVLGKRGVIGRIDMVGENKSRLILVSDPDSRIPVITSKSRFRGILAGNGSSLMDILYLAKTAEIEEEDFVFTSGDGDTLPPGLLVGVVKKADKDSALVAMAEDVDAADIVTIIDY